MTISSTPVDVVGLYNLNFAQFLKEIRPQKASIVEMATAFDQPLEDATSVIDHIIYEPVEIEIIFHLPPPNPTGLYAQLRSLYLEGTPVYVKTRSSVYPNMFIVDLSHDETNKAAASLSVVARFKELLTISQNPEVPNEQYAPVDLTDGDTVDRGIVQSSATVDIPDELLLTGNGLVF